MSLMIFQFVCLSSLQVAAMHAGVGGLVQLGPEVMQRVAAVMQQGGGGVSVHRLWGPGELEFEAYMRMLDSKVGTPWNKFTLLWYRGSAQCVVVCRQIWFQDLCYLHCHTSKANSSAAQKDHIL